ncbi:MAG: exo-alpha-sialidase, partial [Thiohalomonadales bacterium]
MTLYDNKYCFLLMFLAFAAISPVAVSGSQVNIVQKPPSPAVQNGLAETPTYNRSWICKSCGATRVHSATATSTKDGDLIAAWYGGTREGARDVQIYMSILRRGSQGWGKPRAIISVDTAEKDLGRFIKKLGNPVLLTHPNGEIWLFYVSVSAGGWSGSQVNLARSKDGGKSWTTTNRYVTSPFFNV